MKISSPFLVSSAMMTIVLITAAATIAIILLASNFAIANAQQPLEQQQQQEQQLEESDGGGLTAILNGDRQPAAIQSTTLFQSANDGFSIEVPQGWIIHDLNNSGSALSEEGTQGYGVLAQLCPEEEEEQQQGSAATLPNAGGDTLSCERSENYVIHIIRYHDLDNRLPAANNVTTTSSNNNSIITNDNILSYHLKKLQEVGYSDIEIVNSADMTVNLTNPQTNQTIATVPAQFVEMTYSTASAQNEARRSGYLISTATDVTAPNLGATKGYTIFYKGSSLSEAEITLGFGSLRPLPPAVGQVFDSFELIVAPEVAEALAEQAAAGAAETTEGVEDDGDDDGDDGGDDDGEGDGDDGGDDGGDEGEEGDGEGEEGGDDA
jgi:hypothetical protein